jgi:SET domain-containing protein
MSGEVLAERRPLARGRRRPDRLYVLRASAKHGRGAFAAVRIRRGTRIIEYTGERISHAEADARYDDDAMEQHHTLLMIVNRRWVLDAAVGGNDARFINHSCAPNCEIVIERGRVYIDAIADIPPGEEITYDYAYEREEEDDDAIATSRYPCRCGAERCRGTILLPRD